MSMLFKRIKDWATNITAFRTGDVIPVDGPDGTAKMSKDTLLELTAQNALAGNIAQAFDPTRTEDTPYKIGQVVINEGVLYRCRAEHYGDWVSSHFIATSVDAYFGKDVDVAASAGVLPYNGDISVLNGDTDADTSKFYFDARPGAETYKRIMFFTGVWRYAPNNATTKDISNFLAIRKTYNFQVVLEIFFGKRERPTEYNGGISVIEQDPNADKTKVYIATNQSYKLMYWDVQFGCWMYAGEYAFKDTLLLAHLVGAWPYYKGGLSVINDDQSVDTEKIYFNALPSDSDYLKTFVYDSTESKWVYSNLLHTPTRLARAINNLFGVIIYPGSDAQLNADSTADKTKIYVFSNGNAVAWSEYLNRWISVTTFESMLETFNELLGACPYYSGGLGTINADPYVDKTKVYFVPIEGSNFLKRMVYDSVNAVWVYSGYLNKDLNTSILKLIEVVIGAAPYFGDLSMIAEDSTADKNKIYFVALDSSVNNLKTMYYDFNSSAWVYGENVAALKKDDDLFNVENEKVKDYLFATTYDSGDYSYTNVLDYAANNLDKPSPFIVKWNFTGTCDSFNVKVSLDGSFSAEKTYTYNVANSARTFTLQCLDPSKVGGVKVSAVTGNSESVILSKALHAGGNVRMIAVDGIRNVRDIGGWPALEGKKIKYGKFFRGSAIDESGSTITNDGKVILYNLLGVRSEIDLRSTASPTTSAIGPDAIKYSIAGYSYINGFNDTTTAYAVLSRVFTEVAAGHNIYMHCSGGCDRTAFYVCMLEGLLGLSETDITKDFELSSFMDQAYSNNYRRYRSMGETYSNRDWAGLIALIKGVSGDTWTEKFYNYFISLGFTSSEIEIFRNNMLG